MKRFSYERINRITIENWHEEFWLVKRAEENISEAFDWLFPQSNILWVRVWWLYVFKLITLKPRGNKWNYIHIIHKNVIHKLKSQVTSLQSERVKSSWFVFVCYVFTANKNKDKEMKVKACTDELKEIKDMTTEVLHVVKSTNRSNPGDPGSMISVLKELQLALGTFFEQL